MANDVESAEILRTLQDIGLSESKAKETVKNNVITQNLLLGISEAKKSGPISPQCGILLYNLASKIKSQIFKDIPLLVSYITSQKIDSGVRLDAALEWLLTNVNKKFDAAAFEKFCGIGVVVSPDQIEQCVEKNIKKYEKELKKQRYRFNVGLIMQDIRKELRWADGKAVKNEVDLQILDLLGPKTDDDKKPLPKPAKVVDHKSKASNQSKSAKLEKSPKPVENINCDSIVELMRNQVHFHKVGENYKTDGYVVTPNTMDLIKKHLEITGGKVRTRFPPEPNGILHIGHAKAININFGYAKAHGGVCFLRFDDTNPEKEEEKFFEGIKDMVKWLGYEPYKITHSSDYFDQLYDWAVVLIKKGLAYVCHQTSEEIKGFNPPPSPWRNRTVDENLTLFEAMKNGMFDEGEATLRMKVTLEEGKQDPVAYRIKYLPHHRTGDKWCIYPTYDYTHCLCDSIENITHSLCTKEFQSRRSSYYWLCNSLDIYCPVQWEFGRLSINYTVTSKRKIAKLISEGIVKDWDDPRLYTLTALRRKGYPPEAINNFCSRMGVTGASVAVDPHVLQACVRDVLNVTAPRRMVVIDPLKVTILNFPGNGPVNINVPNFPDDPNKGSHSVQFDKVIYIDAIDFRENAEAGYRRLTPYQTVGLRHCGFVIAVKEIVKDSTGKVVELKVNCESSISVSSKPKAFIHWVSNPIKVTIRVYDQLFYHKNPDDTTEVPKGYLSDVKKDSFHEFESLADVSIKSCKPFQSFQFERVGFFTVDPDTLDSKTIFNLTVSLKDDAGKGYLFLDGYI